MRRALVIRSAETLQLGFLPVQVKVQFLLALILRQFQVLVLFQLGSESLQ